MNKRAMTMAAVAVVTTLTLAACGTDDSAGTTAGRDAPSSSSGSSSSGGSATPGSSGTAAAGEHNDADVEFARMMIPHHAQAIGMSEMVLAKDGVAEPVQELAEQIKSAQGPEIAEMTGWLEGWGEGVPDMGDMGDMGEMSGMMQPEDMEELMSVRGDEFDTLWLDMMIEHHTGAITMSQTQKDEGINPEAVALADTIIEAQQAEITEMTQMLESN